MPPLAADRETDLDAVHGMIRRLADEVNIADEPSLDGLPPVRQESVLRASLNALQTTANAMRASKKKDGLPVNPAAPRAGAPGAPRNRDARRSAHAMRIEAEEAPLSAVVALREAYRREMACQIVHDSWHARGFTRLWLLRERGTVVGYGAVGGAPGDARDTLKELFVVPSHRGDALRMFSAVADAGGARWVEAYPELARRIAADGHLVGNHSHYHVRAPLLTPEGFAIDAADAEAVIREATGADPRPWYRLPFGAGADDPAIHERLDRIGYRHVHWDCEVWDWRPELTEREVEDAFVQAVSGVGDGCVALLHPWPGAVQGALPGIVERLTARGATFGTLDALERIPDGRLDEAPV